ERELPYAWVILAVAFFALAIATATRSTIGLLVSPWENEFGWDRAQVSFTASIGLLTYGLAQALAGRWADRFGPRRVFAGSLALLGISMVAVGSVQTLWHAYLAFGIGNMGAVGGASNVTAAVAIARWIKRKKALAMGIVMAGAAAGQVLLVPGIAAFMKVAGWRLAFVWCGASVFLIAAPLMLLFLKDDPPGGAEPRPTRGPADGPPQPLASIAWQKNFWCLAGSFWICGFTTAGLIDPHFIPYAEDMQIDRVTAATAFGVLGIFNVMATLASGAVSDRWGHKWVLGWVYAGRAVTLLFLVFVRDPVMLFVFAVVFGIVYFSTVPPTTVLSTTLFGRLSGGTVVGLVSLSHQIGSATASYVGGLIHDATGSYILFFVSGSLLCTAAAAISWAISETPEPASPEPSLA
ncbi:MAG: MFS transporter, partial [Candidatus Methylomirabilia bacterium]